MGYYDDIIDIKHFEPKHKRMSLDKRAAQFAPFAALTGYNENIIESSRLTDYKRELDDSFKEIISNKINYLKDSHDTCKITYFINDLKKDGGKYEEITSSIEKIDLVNKFVILKDKKKILIDDIVDIII